MSRHTTITQKVPTPFGALYAHVILDAAGAPCEVAISTPGKQHDSTMHEALIALGEAITECLPARVEAPAPDPPA